MHIQLPEHLVGDGAHPVDDRGAVRMQIRGGDGLVVHDQQSAVVGGRRVATVGAHAVVLDRVVMIASTLRVRSGRVRAVIAERRHTRGDRIAQAVEHRGVVAGREADRIGDRLRHRIERQRGRTRRCDAAGCGRHGVRRRITDAIAVAAGDAAEEGQRGEACAAFEHVAPRNDGAHLGVGGTIEVGIEFVVAHGWRPVVELGGGAARVRYANVGTRT